jgi:hypothetical protein
MYGIFVAFQNLYVFIIYSQISNGTPKDFPDPSLGRDGLYERQ